MLFDGTFLTSMVSWAIEQKGQNVVTRQSLHIVPSMPLRSRIFSRTVTRITVCRIGRKKAKPEVERDNFV